ncbi:MAG: hypothetical protein NC299_15455 [Lachnospiraceae bacterium]|nr:hypothetical protein [Ruminococcus sp.]MCM1276730.1 hypothetical protein [Lachnospiraceae bacterium]
MIIPSSAGELHDLISEDYTDKADAVKRETLPEDYSYTETKKAQAAKKASESKAKRVDSPGIQYQKKGIPNDSSVRESFLYNYIREKSELDAVPLSHDREKLLEYAAEFDKKRKYTYTALCAARKAFDRGVITPGEYKKIFLNVNGRSKTGSERRKKLFDDFPEQAYEQLADRLLRTAAENRIDIWRRESKSTGTQLGKHTDEVGMLFEFDKYRRKKGLDGFFGSAAPSSAESSFDLNAHIVRCAELYEIMRGDDERSDALVPLYFDKFTGAGVYLVGKKILPPDLANVENSDSVFVCVLSFSDFIRVDSNEIFYDDDCALSLNFFAEKCQSVKEAFDLLKSEDYLDSYAMSMTARGLPKGADEFFRNHFFESEIAVKDEEDDIKNVRSAKGARK